MKGYEVAVGYMGYVDGEYMLFASETEYLEFMREVAHIYLGKLFGKVLMI